MLCKFATIVICMLCSVSTVWGIKCFQCNSLVDSACEGLTTMDTYSPFLKDCVINPDNPNHKNLNGSEFFCRVVTQHIKGRNDLKVISRRCSWLKDKKPCYEGIYSNWEYVCQCFEDACNTAAPTTITKYCLIFVFIICIAVNFLK